MSKQSGSLVADLVNEMQQPGGNPYQMQGPPMMMGQGMPMHQGQPGPGMQHGGVAPVGHYPGMGMPPPQMQQQMPPQMQQQMPPQMQQQMQQMQQQMPPQMPGQGAPYGYGQGQQQYEDQEEMDGPDMGEEYTEDDDMPAPPREMMQYDQRGPQMMDVNQFGMEQGNKSWVDSIMEGLKDPLIIALLFMVLSLPQVNRTLIQLLPIVGNNLYYNLGFKALFMAVLFFFIKYFLG